MTTKDTKNSSPLVELDADFQTAYALVIEKGEDANRENLNFILDTAELLNSKKLTQEVASASMKAIAKDVKIGVVVKYGHVPALTITARIILKYASEMDNQSASKMLTLGSRVLADKKAKGANAHIDSFSTVAELDKNTLSKAEATARDKGEEKLDTVAAIAAIDAATIEGVMDGILEFFKGKNLGDLSTVELEKAKKVTAIFHAIVKNSQA